MSAHEFTISAADLDAGGKGYRFPVRAAWVRGALEDHEASAGKSDGVLEVRASKSGHDVVVRGALETELEVPCARCLTPFALPVRAELGVLYVPASRLKARGGGGGADGEEYELSSEEADTLPFDGETIVLDDLVRDELLLEIPMIPLCSEACPGMSPGPEAAPDPGRETKGIDPRLAPLMQFRGKPTKT